jgi:hypothetical protein
MNKKLFLKKHSIVLHAEGLMNKELQETLQKVTVAYSETPSTRTYLKELRTSVQRLKSGQFDPEPSFNTVLLQLRSGSA